METITSTQKNIVILGAGYGGLRTALRLEHLLRNHSDYRITLVDQNQHHQIVTRLHEVASGRTPASAAALPLSDLLGSRGIHFHQAMITEVDISGRRVSTDLGDLGYDYLVIALGSETNYYGISGMQEHSFSLKSLRDACLVQGHIHEMLAKASGLSDPEARRAALSFIVGGGGFTGVELATELAESLRDLAPRYQIDPNEPRVAIVEAAKALMGGLDPVLVANGTRIVESMAIDLAMGVPAKAADAEGLILANDQRINTHTVVWAGGVKAPDVLQRWGLPVGAAGRVKVNGFLQVDDHPEIYAVGDNALVMDPKSQRPAAPSAQLAVAQAEKAAWNIRCAIEGKPGQEYAPHMTGEAVSLGSTNGVAWVGPVKFSGRPAQLLKDFIAKRYLWETGGLNLVRTYSGLGKSTVGRDFPECVVEFRPAAPTESAASTVL